jgi:pyruvate,orthophosphate dikinase
MRIYSFGNGRADGSDRLESLLGRKGASLVEMSRLGIPVPAGFTLSTEVCGAVLTGDEETPGVLRRLLSEGIEFIESADHGSFGDPDNPLLVSVRTSPPVSMPDVLPTVLNVGLNAETTEGLASTTGDRRFAMDAWVRFIEMFGQIVLDVDAYYFSEAQQEVFERERVYDRSELDSSQLLGLAEKFLSLTEQYGTRAFPHSPSEQLALAVDALFNSWESPRSRRFRRTHNIADDTYTAVSVQMMVFGNQGESSGTGLATTRNRHDGTAEIDGLFVPDAQGEAFRDRRSEGMHLRHSSQPSVESEFPDIFEKASRIATTLEAHYRTCQRFEFTVENGSVWVLQTEQFDSLPVEAKIKVAVEMVDEGLIERADALQRIDAPSLSSLLLPRLEETNESKLLARGTGTTPGAASGFVVFTPEEAERYAELNMGVILVRTETTTDDMEAIRLSRGVVTSRGGMTSHAAIVTRQMGIPCIVGASRIRINRKAKKFTVGDQTFEQGDVLTIDGATGQIFEGSVPIVPSHLPDTYHRLLEWADEARSLAVRSNADNSVDAGLARKLGAAGIGLVRTEHMFFHRDRLNPMRRVILAHSERVRREALKELLPYQRQDFFEIFKVMDGLPVTVRLFDPPLHEFLPERDQDLEALGRDMGLPAENVRQIARNIRELNPMLGHRGCRLAISYPEIYDMQVRAVGEALELAVAEGIEVYPELLVPLVSIPEELRRLRKRIDRILTEFDHVDEFPDKIPIGSMIEVARACLLADEIAKHADFISFGTNDLTQSVFGISRDDASVFLPRYVNEGIIDANPFLSLDTTGVGALIETAVERARSTNPEIRIGLCGEQGGDPKSVAWLQQGVVDYISCSPYRVPIARLAAGQAAIQS